MSLDIFVYSPSMEPVAIAEFEAAARRDGWEIRVLRGLEHSWTGYTVVTGGCLEDCDELCGWPSNDPRSSSVAEAIQRQFGPVLRRMVDHDAFGCCHFYSEVIPADIKVNEQYPEDTELERPQFLRGVFTPQMLYTLNCSAGPGIVYGEFFDFAAPWLARACRGAWLDPQTEDCYGICFGSDPSQ